MSPHTIANPHLDQQRSRSVAQDALSVKTPGRPRRTPGLTPGPPRPMVGIVVDTQYLLTSACNLGRTRLDYGRIISDVVAGADWVGVACVARPLSNKSIDGFLAFLGNLGLTPLVWQSPVAAGQRKVNLDALVVREATCLIVEGGLKELCIVGPDCDFYVLAELCRQRGVKFAIAGFRHTIGGFMRVQADRVVELGSAHLLAGAA
jgi:hypothetical protein